MLLYVYCSSVAPWNLRRRRTDAGRRRGDERIRAAARGAYFAQFYLRRRRVRAALLLHSDAALAACGGVTAVSSAARAADARAVLAAFAAAPALTTQIDQVRAALLSAQVLNYSSLALGDGAGWCSVAGEFLAAQTASGAQASPPPHSMLRELHRCFKVLMLVLFLPLPLMTLVLTLSVSFLQAGIGALPAQLPSGDSCQVRIDRGRAERAAVAL